MLDKRLFDQLYRYCYSLTCNEDDAWELLQGSVEKCLAAGIEMSADNRFYMMKVIRNRLIDDWRKNARTRTEPFDEEKHLDFDIRTLEQVVIDQDMLETLWVDFKPVEREILFLWAVEGYTTAEVARWLEMPKGTVLSHISRLRKRVLARTDQLDKVM